AARMEEPADCLPNAADDLADFFFNRVYAKCDAAARELECRRRVALRVQRKSTVLKYIVVDREVALDSQCRAPVLDGGFNRPLPVAFPGRVRMMISNAVDAKNSKSAHGCSTRHLNSSRQTPGRRRKLSWLLSGFLAGMARMVFGFEVEKLHRRRAAAPCR